MTTESHSYAYAGIFTHNFVSYFVVYNKSLPWS